MRPGLKGGGSTERPSHRRGDDPLAYDPELGTDYDPRDQTFNASALARVLAGSEQYKDLAGKIQMAVDTFSVQADLAMARESCAAPNDLHADIMFPREGSKHAKIIGYSLMCHAIVLYSRGLKTKSAACATMPSHTSVLLRRTSANRSGPMRLQWSAFR